MREIHARPIGPAAWAPFGALVSAREAPPRICNHGTAEAWDALATLEGTRPGARAEASLFRCRPHRGGRLEVRWLERHPCSTQLFAPLGRGRYLLVVAHGDEAPDPSTLAAFLVEGAQAITYAPGTWHHPMVALDAPLDFVNLLHVDGTDADCEEVAFDPPCARVRW
ncbi:MAG TPA: ureidoglycolate lyase [Sandaracinaceae bacterium LLY-WYZ-13_1]|nr:ureidoglycolate lyase [Sandaracinaceae bacterium LLY-WYZ-13_1]